MSAAPLDQTSCSIGGGELRQITFIQGAGGYIGRVVQRAGSWRAGPLVADAFLLSVYNSVSDS